MSKATDVGAQKRKLARAIVLKIDKARKARGWKNADIARALADNPKDAAEVQHHSSTVSKWSRPNPPLLKATTLEKLGKELDLSADWLLGRDVPMRVHARTPIGSIEKELAQYVVKRALKGTKHGLGPVRRSIIAEMLGIGMTHSSHREHVDRVPRSTVSLPDEPGRLATLARAGPHAAPPDLEDLPAEVLEALGRRLVAHLADWLDEEVELRARALAKRQTTWLEERLALQGLELDRDYELMTENERRTFFSRIRDVGQLLSRRTIAEKVAEGEPFPDVKTEVAFALNYRKRRFYHDLSQTERAGEANERAGTGRMKSTK